MAMWHVVLYSVGTVFALRSLVSLMAHHKHNYERILRGTSQQGLDRAGNSDPLMQKPKDAAVASAKPSAA